MSNELLDSGAVFSDCRTYRYVLYRDWDFAKPVLLFIMLNPSTADEKANDPTVERCERRARKLGYGGIKIVNLFALRSTDPKFLYSHVDPIGVNNDEYIKLEVLKVVLGGGDVVCAWGRHGNLFSRNHKVLQKLKELKAEPKCLGITADGNPKHPLYISYDVQLEKLK